MKQKQIPQTNRKYSLAAKGIQQQERKKFTKLHCGQESRSTSSDFYATKCIPKTFNFPNAFNHWHS